MGKTLVASQVPRLFHIARVRLLALALLGLLAFEANVVHGQERSATTTLIVYEEAGTCGDCVRMTPLFSLGDTATFRAGPAALEAARYVAMDGAGSYWIGQINSFKVFDSTGELLGDLGRQGQGPGEFANYPGPAFSDGLGNVHIIDVRNARESVFNSARELIDEYPLVATVYAAAALSQPDRRVVNANVHMPSSAGLPLHIVEDDSIQLSFGGADGETLVRDFDLQRIVRAGPTGRICAGERYHYVVTCWDGEGRLLARFEGPVLNDPPVEAGVVTMAQGLPAQIADLYLADDGRLGVLRHQRSATWRSHVSEAVAPNGAIGIKIENSDLIYDAYLDVLEESSGRLISTQRLDVPLIGFLRPGLAWQLQHTAAGAPYVTIWRLSF